MLIPDATTGLARGAASELHNAGRASTRDQGVTIMKSERTRGGRVSKSLQRRSTMRAACGPCIDRLEGRVLFSNIGAGPGAIPQVVADLNGDGHADVISTSVG